MKGKRVLLVEDNKKIMAGNAKMFTREGYEVTSALSLADARDLISKNCPDVIVLDITLPDGNGLDFMKEIRQGENAAIPILLLSGLAAKEDVIHGLRSGGDDYLIKPYDFSVLLARVGALLRRSVKLPEYIHKGRLSIKVMSGIALYDGKDLLLSQKEYALLLVFIQNENVFIKAEHLYEMVWNAPMGSDSTAIRSAIKRLRAKIEGCGWSIEASIGKGYIFEKS